jgi:thiol-disulfide isomerase/thioredoxin
MKKALMMTALAAATLAVTLGVLYVANTAPKVAAVSVEEAARSGKPYVVKLHAQWCVYCLATKDVWSQIEATYAGRVHLIVFDFTNESTSAASQAEAARLGLEAFHADFDGVTGSVVVLEGRTKEVTAEIHGRRDFSEYRTAIDAALTQ